MRFKNQRSKLNKLGWHVYVVWECETKYIDDLERKITKIFEKVRAN